MPKLWKPPNYQRTPLHKLFVVVDVEVVDVEVVDVEVVDVEVVDVDGDVLVVVAVNRFEMEQN